MLRPCDSGYYLYTEPRNLYTRFSGVCVFLKPSSVLVVRIFIGNVGAAKKIGYPNRDS